MKLLIPPPPKKKPPTQLNFNQIQFWEKNVSLPRSVRWYTMTSVGSITLKGEDTLTHGHRKAHKVLIKFCEVCESEFCIFCY